MNQNRINSTRQQATVFATSANALHDCYRHQTGRNFTAEQWGFIMKCQRPLFSGTITADSFYSPQVRYHMDGVFNNAFGAEHCILTESRIIVDNEKINSLK